MMASRLPITSHQQAPNQMAVLIENLRAIKSVTDANDELPLADEENNSDDEQIKVCE